jgi:serine/threonine protein kinase
MAMSAPKPGAYTLRCRQCGVKLKLRVPDDPALTIVLSDEEEATVADGGVTLGETKVAVGGRTGSFTVRQAPAASAGHDPDATVAENAAPDRASSMDETVAATELAAPSAVAVRGGSAGGRSVVAKKTPASGGGGSVGHGAGSSESFEVPQTLGGYRLLDELGKGGMGAVYRARQVSLDRDVALKVMAPRLASNPTFVARFCREAYAAAQLVHHNVVQIYDFGEENGTHYFSMEFVDGLSLAKLVKERGRLTSQEAAGYVLQAARGLKQAHDRGMIHRDIKPDNLMLSKHGMVKVADLGLVRAVAAMDLSPMVEPGEAAEEDPEQGGPPKLGVADRGSLAAEVTRFDVAMGTPAYMAPEQARNAAGVDQRADIYALGCTLYTLVTGRPPFEGKSAMDLITKHATEPVVPPEVIIKDTPEALSALILKMVAKQPDERYRNLDEVIEALERFLKVPTAQGLAGRPEEAKRLAETLGALGRRGAEWTRKATIGLLGAACAVGAVGGLISGHPKLAGAVLGLGLLTPVAYVMLGEIWGGSELWRRARQWAVESRTGERLAVAAVVLLALAVFGMMGILWHVVGIAAGAVALAWPARLVIEGTKADQEPVQRVQEVLKDMRVRGFDEEAIRKFVAERAGPKWDKVRDAVFGSDERLAAWRSRGQAEWERARSGLAAWRDWAVRWFESRVADRQDERVRKHLEQVEKESLAAQGMSLDAAYKKARQAAEAMMVQADQLRKAGLRASRAIGGAITSEEERRKMVRSLHEAAERPEQILQAMERGLLARRSEESLNAILGPRTRFIAGVVLVALFVLWSLQNGWRGEGESTRPLWLPLVPSFITGMVRDWNAAIAGMVLMASALARGWRISLLIIPGAAIMLIGSTLGLPAWLSLIVGIAIAGAGFALAVKASDDQSAPAEPLPRG